MAHRDHVKEESIIGVQMISPELIKLGEDGIATARELDRQLKSIESRARILLAEKEVIYEKQQACRDEFYREVYAVHPELADVECAYSTEKKAIVIYEEGETKPDISDLIDAFRRAMAADMARPPKEGAN